MDKQSIQIQSGKVKIDGDLAITGEIKGIVVFAHGSGSSRFSQRNRFVAQRLNEAGFGTLLIDLLTPDEEDRDSYTAELRFDIDLLASRLISATEWLRKNKISKKFKIGYFGASTGAAAALQASAKIGNSIFAVVSRGGRPDLAFDWLSKVKSPALLIVGENDTTVIRLNKEALGKLNAEKKLTIIPGATHLFEEPGALELVSDNAVEWFLEHAN
ncbi:MAG: dienelactone hydrolase family protein [bacterium]|nr:dienelactone hydrolase family protein [bacterium]